MGETVPGDWRLMEVWDNKGGKDTSLHLRNAGGCNAVVRRWCWRVGMVGSHAWSTTQGTRGGTHGTKGGAQGTRGSLDAWDAGFQPSAARIDGPVLSLPFADTSPLVLCHMKTRTED